MKKKINLSIQCLFCSLILLLAGCGNTQKTSPTTTGKIKSELQNTISPTEGELPFDSSAKGANMESPVKDKTEGVDLRYMDQTFLDTTGSSEGLAAVQDSVSGMWGFIDYTGEYVIEPQYYGANPFSEGLAAVNIDDHWGFIDHDNNLVIPAEYTFMIPDEAMFKNGKVSPVQGGVGRILIDRNGNEILEQEDEIPSTPSATHSLNCYGVDYHELRSTIDNSLCIMDSSGKLVVNISKLNNGEFDECSIECCTEKTIVIYRTVNNIKTSALIDYEGNVLIGFQYKSLYPLSGNKLFLAEQADNTTFLIDCQGNILRELGYARSMRDRAKYYSDNICSYAIYGDDSRYAGKMICEIEVIDNQSGEVLQHIIVPKDYLEGHTSGHYLFFENCYLVSQIYDYNSNILFGEPFSMHAGDVVGSITNEDYVLIPYYDAENKNYSFVVVE